MGKNVCPRKTGQCFLSFFWIDKNDYSVVSTDYTTYAVVKGCEEFLFGAIRQELYWILVRDPNAATAVTDVAEAALLAKVPDYDQKLNHVYSNRGGSCPYAP